MQILIATIKQWNIDNAAKLKKEHCEWNVDIITEKEKLTDELLAAITPDYIFFPHWSWTIPSSIYEKYDCIVFHMTDLPFGRGGSPLQNLLVRGIYETKISAIKVSAGMDTGDVYLKKPLNISTGSAEDILSKASNVIFHDMIPVIIDEKPSIHPQEGDVVDFKRRTPEMSEIPEGLNQRQLYDYIRMLDGEGYPTAFRRYDGGKIYYWNARMENDVVYAYAEFRRDER